MPVRTCAINEFRGCGRFFAEYGLIRPSVNLGQWKWVFAGWRVLWWRQETTPQQRTLHGLPPPLSPSNLTHGASHRVIFLKTPPTHRLDLDSATLHRPPWPVPCRSMPETPQSDALPALIGHHPCRFSHPRLLHRNAI